MNPYDILKIDRKATQEDIQKAFHRRANETHPDKGGTHDDFINLKKSYKLLMDEKTRRRYDQTGQFEDPDVAKEPILDQAVAIINGVIEVIVNSDNSNVEQNLFESLKIGVRAYLEDANSVVQSLTAKKKKLERLKKSLKRKLKSKPEKVSLIDILDRKITFIDIQLDKPKEELQAAQTALNIVEGYYVEPNLQEKKTGPNNPFFPSFLNLQTA